MDDDEQRHLELKSIIQSALAASGEMELFLERLKQQGIDVQMVLTVEALFIHGLPACEDPVTTGPFGSLSDSEFMKAAGVREGD